MNWLFRIKAVRLIGTLLVVPTALSGTGIAQAKPAPAANLADTLLWMNHFSHDHGFVADDRGIRISNQFLSKGCDASIEVAFPKAKTTKRTIRRRRINVKLGELNPKVTLQTDENVPAVQVYFERADAQMKIHETMEYGGGARLEALVTNETLYFDTRGSAIRFARAFSRAINWCSEISPT